MEKLWAGRFSKELDQTADDFNSSILFDSRMYRQDIQGSIEHAAMLAKQNIISSDDCRQIVSELLRIQKELEEGTLSIDPNAEDIHMFIESVLTKRIGDAGKRLHTARSRNDQVALDLRLYLREECETILSLIRSLVDAIVEKAQDNLVALLPGYTHLQRAQPISFAHHLLAYGMMFSRDISRLQDAVKRMNVSPLGSCALAGTTYPIDRAFVADKLGFDGYTLNSLDGVSDRDFCVEIGAALSVVMMHLSRFSEELILWTSWEFGFVELDDSFTTGSSIMPQKKNSDMAELVRGKTGRVYGNLMGTLTMLKGLPLAYNKDMQEDKEAIFDSVDTVKKCLEVFAPMILTMKVNREAMYNAAQKGFINATDLADYLTKKGLPFRRAYQMVGQIVSHCLQNNLVLDTLPLETYKNFSPLFEQDLYAEISLETCVSKRTSPGGTGTQSLLDQIKYLRGVVTN
ncbi:MAG TPA: argininosuccinate lyase [Clostridiales bacterium]|jgi:argininosuccinate lyase|nr:argininosuccinate lyase [Clostridiales bacterium]